MPRLPPLISFIAPSGTGKTTLIEGVVAELSRRGLRVAVLKHDAHRLELDKPGKDTWRFRQAGAWRALVAGEEQLALFSSVDGELTLGGLVDVHLADADIVISEGFRKSGLPAIRVHRAARPADPSWRADNPLIAWASDEPLSVSEPVLPLNDPAAVVDFLVERLLGGRSVHRRATGVVPVRAGEDPVAVGKAIAAVGAACEGRVLAVLAPGATGPANVRAVADLRPGLGALGGLLTALASVDTPEVLFLGAERGDVPVALLDRMLRWGPRAADVVAPDVGGFPDPVVAVYGHRCLSAIQGSLLSGEAKLTGWWGQVRVHRVPEADWRALAPDGAGFKRR